MDNRPSQPAKVAKAPRPEPESPYLRKSASICGSSFSVYSVSLADVVRRLPEGRWGGLSAIVWAYGTEEEVCSVVNFFCGCNRGGTTQGCLMVAVVVHLQVKPDSLDQFVAETKVNARNSRKEPGVVRFDVIQEVDDPSRFVLFELYRDQEAIEAHRGTAHYANWRDAVPAFLVTERTRTIYRAIEPD